MEAVIVEELVKIYGNFKVLDAISFRVTAGEIYGYLGPNGAGKTTTIRILTGLTGATSGTCRLLGKPVETADKGLFRKIGVVPEEKNLYERLSGEENLKFFAHLYGTGRERINFVLKKFDLFPARRKKVKNYSRGMKQRLLICRALLHNPELLILDEPTDGLDPVSADIIRKAVRELAGKGKTVLLSSHNMDEVDELCDRIAFLKQGNIISEGSPGELKRKYGQPLLEVKVRFNKRGDLTAITGPEDRIIFTGGNTAIFHLSLKDSTPGKKLDRIKEEARILSIHSREAALKEVFRRLS